MSTPMGGEKTMTAERLGHLQMYIRRHNMESRSLTSHRCVDGSSATYGLPVAVPSGYCRVALAHCEMSVEPLPCARVVSAHPQGPVCIAESGPGRFPSDQE